MIVGSVSQLVSWSSWVACALHSPPHLVLHLILNSTYRLGLYTFSHTRTQRHSLSLPPSLPLSSFLHRFLHCVLLTTTVPTTTLEVVFVVSCRVLLHSAGLFILSLFRAASLCSFPPSPEPALHFIPPSSFIHIYTYTHIHIYTPPLCLHQTPTHTLPSQLQLSSAPCPKPQHQSLPNPPWFQTPCTQSPPSLGSNSSLGREMRAPRS